MKMVSEILKSITLSLVLITVMSCENSHNTGCIQPTGPVTMNLYYTGTNGNARKFVEEMESSGTADAIRAEQGNLRYDYFFSAADPETVLLIDSWTDQTAIDAHHASPVMEKLAVLREKYDLHMKVERYLADDRAADETFIRK